MFGYHGLENKAKKKLCMNDSKVLLNHCKKIADWNHHMIRYFWKDLYKPNKHKSKYKKDLIVCYCI